MRKIQRNVPEELKERSSREYIDCKKECKASHKRWQNKWWIKISGKKIMKCTRKTKGCTRYTDKEGLK